MKKKVATPVFKITLGEFAATLRPKISFMRRDQSEFLRFGINPSKIDELDGKFETYLEIPTDKELEGSQVMATQDKDAASAVLSSTIGSILTRAANKFGEDSGKYRKFGIHSLSTLSDGDLSMAARRVKRVALEFLDELQSEGLTAEIIDSLDQNRQVFDSALGTQQDAIANRDIASETRILTANAIYLEMVKVCDTGKRIWAEQNEAKYNDYVIYNTASGKAETTQAATTTAKTV